MTALEQDPCTRVHLWHDLAAVADARRALVQDLEQAELDRRAAQDVVLVFSELASNAVEHGPPHGCGHVEATWCLYDTGARLTVAGDVDPEVGEEVLDRFQPGEASQFAARGRGLAIVDHVCEQWGVDLDDGTVRVTAQIVFAS
ncbi:MULTISPECIES: ATP-binding protein [unclassified Nocardioides]|uniref:ATP-binding protein n=1 Tax=unclassified Nocardioides TaxID=2615069 RepID=UPI00266522B1|nr:ATP-binding protein [Nocardioides sp. Arc9.136]WKN48121.1 ATP-binding protein [Nocardioides sp. Arc9.136]